jgi:hypothetical protein
LQQTIIVSKGPARYVKERAMKCINMSYLQRFWRWSKGIDLAHYCMENKILDASLDMGQMLA